MVMRKTQKDVGNFQSKLIGPFTARQTVFVGIGVIIDIFVYSILKGTGLDINSIIPVCFIVMVPFIALAYIHPYGMKCEEFLYQYYIYHIAAPPVRKYETHTALDDIPEKLSKEEQKVQKRLHEKMKKHKECKEYPSFL